MDELILIVDYYCFVDIFLCWMLRFMSWSAVQDTNIFGSVSVFSFRLPIIICRLEWERNPKPNLLNLGLGSHPVVATTVPPKWSQLESLSFTNDATQDAMVSLRSASAHQNQNAYYAAAFHRVGSPPYVANESNSNAYCSSWSTVVALSHSFVLQSSYTFISLKFILLCPTSLKVALTSLEAGLDEKS